MAPPRGRSALAQPTDLPDVEPLPAPPRPTGSLTFRQPATDLQEPPSPPDPADDSPSDVEPSESWPEKSDAPQTSSPTSSGSGEPPQKIKDLIVEGGRALVLMAGAAAHQSLARSETARAVEMWATDDDDAEAIGDPLAGMANRRLGAIANASSPDAEDLIGAVVGIVTYGIKQYRKWMAGREMRRAAAAQGLAEPRSAEPVGDGPGTGAAPGSAAENA